MSETYRETGSPGFAGTLMAPGMWLTAYSSNGRASKIVALCSAKIWRSSCVEISGVFWSGSIRVAWWTFTTAWPLAYGAQAPRVSHTMSTTRHMGGDTACIFSSPSVLERISYERTAYRKTLDARFREHDDQEVIPAHAGIQEPYRQSQAALRGDAV